MLNAVYRLVSPRRFEVAFHDTPLLNDEILVRPTHLSICHADQRYYQGLRSMEVLKEKLPMALIHEAVGEVVYDSRGEYKSGQSVVLIPNTPTQKDEIIAENYLRSSKFRASGFDGFMQDVVVMGRDRMIPLPDGIDKSVASFTELVSVSVHAVLRFQTIAHGRRDTIGIWGDGNLGYITALILKAILPETKLIIFGASREKLDSFVFADETYLAWDMPNDLKVDHAFECVGGDASQKAIDQIIGCICPEGTISLLGVSEYAIPIDTRMVLEKGLRLFGTSRSGYEDFMYTVALYKEKPEILNYLSNLVGAQVEIRSIGDMVKAFECDICKSIGKTIMIWNK